MRVALIIVLSVVTGIAVTGCGPPGQPGSRPDAAAVRVGVYDSRAIAIAAVGSDYYTDHIKPLEVALRQAKAEGNTKLVTQLEPKVWARRKQTHRQGFGTAPVDDMLDYIRDELPAITRQADIVAIISKWDRKSLSKYRSATQVDVTMALVEAFRPKAKSLEWAREIQKKPPVSSKTLEAHISRHSPP